MTALLSASACSYEGSLFGWELQVDEKHKKDEANFEYGVKFSLHFGFSTNINSNITGTCLKAVKVSGKSSLCRELYRFYHFIYNEGGGRYLVCAGQDEKLKIYNLIDLKAVGDISTFSHSGGITCLDFYRDAYLISGSEVRNHLTLVQQIYKYPPPRTAPCACGEYAIGNVCIFLVATKVFISLKINCLADYIILHIRRTYQFSGYPSQRKDGTLCEQGWNDEAVEYGARFQYLIYYFRTVCV